MISIDEKKKFKEKSSVISIDEKKKFKGSQVEARDDLIDMASEGWRNKKLLLIPVFFNIKHLV